MRSLELKKRVKTAMLGAAVEVMVIIIMAAMPFLFAGCEGDVANKNNNITILTREDGSGTRRAFVELTGILKGKQDRTTIQAEVTNSNFVVMMSVAQDKNAIGYVSLGTLDNDIENVKSTKSVKAVKIDGVEATAQNIKEGKYSLARKFSVVVRDDLSRAGRDFIDYIISDEGQEIIEQQGYIGEKTGNTYKPAKVAGLKGKVTLAGSTSAAPVLEVLTEEYKKCNPDVIFEIQQTGSTAGIEAVAKGVCDIGMVSRELNDSEHSKGLTEIKIATDGIAVIVNKDNELSDISKENIAEIYMGHITNWDDVK